MDRHWKKTKHLYDVLTRNLFSLLVWLSDQKVIQMEIKKHKMICSTIKVGMLRNGDKTKTRYLNLFMSCQELKTNETVWNKWKLNCINSLSISCFWNKPVILCPNKQMLTCKILLWLKLKLCFEKEFFDNNSKWMLNETNKIVWKSTSSQLSMVEDFWYCRTVFIPKRLWSYDCPIRSFFPVSLHTHIS